MVLKGVIWFEMSDWVHNTNISQMVLKGVNCVYNKKLGHMVLTGVNWVHNDKIKSDGLESSHGVQSD